MQLVEQPEKCGVQASSSHPSPLFYTEETFIDNKGEGRRCSASLNFISTTSALYLYSALTSSSHPSPLFTTEGHSLITKEKDGAAVQIQTS